jgi:SMC interacting uncharacterized protein involved in chromosome segregation
MKKLKEYFLLIKTLRKRMVAVKEMMDLAEVTNVYAEYVCKMHNRSKWYMGGLTDFYVEIGQSFMNGYIKALHDNGLEFKNGLVKKRDITNDMPLGALDYYRKDAIKEIKDIAIDALQKVLRKYEMSKTNIAIIVSDFRKEINGG